MNKSQLKKELHMLTKELLIEQILGLYDAYKPVKEYLKVFLNLVNINELFDQYKGIIIKKFNPDNISWNMQTCYPVAKKSIADFSTLKPPPKLLTGLMVTLTERFCFLSDKWGDMPEQHYASASNWLVSSLKFLKNENLLYDFKKRIKKCVKYANDCGGGFSVEINDVFEEYYP